ncbi:MAG: DUF3593 domain-containing protein [Synechococcus sp.]|nr:DUF3593 domain-containing protein [Synechococcus sp.]
MSDPDLPFLPWLAGFDPAPLFVLSLLPYLAFLVWAGRLRAFPRLALRGFQLTLLFVAVTIVAAIVAERLVGRQLADVDPLHGGAEAFLTLSNLLVALGFTLANGQPPPAAPPEPEPEPDPEPPAR